MKIKQLHRFLIFFTLTLNFILISGKPVQGKTISGVYETVILSSPQDPYYALAEEISTEEKIPVFQSIEDLTDIETTYLLWIASPQLLSEKAIFEFSTALNSGKSDLAVGIITGKTIDDAKSLWKGAVRIPVENYAIVIGGKPDKIEPGIYLGSNDQLKSIPYNKENILSTLQDTDLMQISIEGAAQSWFDQTEGITIKYSELPDFHSTIIQHYGCDTLRPWAENSIALQAIHNGAIAYLGFVYPSITGTRFGDYSDINLLKSWEDFPIGQIVQIQNHAAMQSYANSPHFFLIGDPRIYISNKMPYSITRDEETGKTRLIELSNVESGFIPVIIKNGAGYDYVRINGVTSSSMQEQYFNNQLQMININEDKYILFKNNENFITIELKKNAPILRTMSNNAINFIDSIFTDSLGTNFPIVLAIPVLLLTVFKSIRKKYPKRELITAALTGFCFTLLAITYFLLRQSHIQITNIPTKINWWYMVSVFIFTGTGALFFARASTLFSKILALIISNFYSVITFLLFASAAFVKQIVIGATLDINRAGYPYSTVAVRMIIGFVFYFVIFSIVKRILNRMNFAGNNSISNMEKSI